MSFLDGVSVCLLLRVRLVLLFLLGLLTLLGAFVGHRQIESAVLGQDETQLGVFFKDAEFGEVHAKPYRHAARQGAEAVTCPLRST